MHKNTNLMRFILGFNKQNFDYIVNVKILNRIKWFFSLSDLTMKMWPGNELTFDKNKNCKDFDLSLQNTTARHINDSYSHLISKKGEKNISKIRPFQYEISYSLIIIHIVYIQYLKLLN